MAWLKVLLLEGHRPGPAQEIHKTEEALRIVPMIMFDKQERLRYVGVLLVTMGRGPDDLPPNTPVLTDAPTPRAYERGGPPSGPRTS